MRGNPAAVSDTTMYRNIRMFVFNINIQTVLIFGIKVVLVKMEGNSCSSL